MFPNLHASPGSFLARIRRQCFKDENTLIVDLDAVQVLDTDPFQKCSAPQVKEVKKRRTISGMKKKAKKAKLLTSMESAIEELRQLEAQDDEEEEDAYLAKLTRKKLEDETTASIQQFSDSVQDYTKLDDDDLRQFLKGVRYCHQLIIERRKKLD